MRGWDTLPRSPSAISFTDCTSFMLMRGLGLDTAAILEDDFRREGIAGVPAS